MERAQTVGADIVRREVAHSENGVHETPFVNLFQVDFRQARKNGREGVQLAVACLTEHPAGRAHDRRGVQSAAQQTSYLEDTT